MGVAVAQVGISLLSSYIIGRHMEARLGSAGQPTPDDPLLDDKPATKAQRGSVLPVVIGREMIGPVIEWLESSLSTKIETSSESSGAGGKGASGGGGGDTEHTIYFQGAKHGLCVGPGFRLRRIWEDGKVLWPAPGEFLNGITWGDDATIGVDRYPSNSKFECNDEGGGNDTTHKSYFRIFWGEADQARSSRVRNDTGVFSRFPFEMWIEWNYKRLGGFPNWPSLEYEVEVRPYRSGMTKAASATNPDWYSLTFPSFGSVATAGDGWLENGQGIDTATCKTILGFIDDQVKVCGDVTATFTAGLRTNIDMDISSIDGNYNVDSSTYNALETANVHEEFLHGRDVDWSTTLADLGATWTLISTGGYGVPPGATAGSSFPRFTIRKVGAVDANIQAVLNSVIGYDPPGTGGDNDFGSGENSITLYVRANEQNFNDGDTFRVGFSSASGFLARQYSTFQWNSAGPDFSLVSDTNGAVGSISYVEDSTTWQELTVKYRTGDGATNIPAAGSVVRILIELDDGVPIGVNTFSGILRTSSSGGSSEFLMTEGLRASVEYEDLTTCTGVTTIDIDATTALNLSDAYTGGQICAYALSEFGPQGTNLAHLIYQLMFETYPHGLGLEDTRFDLASLQAIGLLVDPNGEGLRTHAFLKDGNDFKNALDSIFEDYGVMVSWDVTTGLYKFLLIRDTDPEIDLPIELISGKNISSSRTLENGVIPKIVYAFKNHEFRFREDDVVLPDYGNARTENSQNRDRQKIDSVRDFDAAVQVAERRGAAAVSLPVPVQFEIDREGVLLRPGDLVTLPTVAMAASSIDSPPLIENAIRIVTVKVPAVGTSAVIKGSVDSYSTPPTNFASKYSGGSSAGTGFTVPTAITQDSSTLNYTDTAQQVFEMPGFLSRSLSFMFLRLPSTESQGQAAGIISDDGTTYQSSTIKPVRAVGGAVISDFNADYVEEGVVDVNDTVIHSREIEYGPAFSSVLESPLDLPVLNDASWHAGKLILLVDSELMLIREVQPLGGTSYQARGVIRGAFGTTLSNHTTDAFVYIIPSSSFKAAVDVLPAKGVLSYAKMLVQVGKDQQPAALATEHQFTPTGKSLRAFDPLNLRNEQMNMAFVSGEDVVLKWDYRLHSGYEKRTGAGFQGYGEAVNHDSELHGTITVAILDITGTILHRTISGLTSATYTYTSIDRVADFGLESSFRVDVQFIGNDADASGRASQTFELI